MYETLGLLPQDFDLKGILLDLYSEQVVGYYDPATKALFVITGANPVELRPVLVHELVHALQDQHANLDSLIARERGNDRQTAAQSAIEGHATMVMVAYVAEEQNKGPVNIQALPDIEKSIRPMMEAQNSQFPVFQKAPRVLRETLVFPYVTVPASCRSCGCVRSHRFWRSVPRASRRTAAELDRAGHASGREVPGRA